MKIAKVYDNGSQTFEPYTTICDGYLDALGLSDNCNRLTQEEQK